MGDRGAPVANRYVSKKLEDERIMHHRTGLAKVKKRVDTAPPTEFLHVSSNPKRKLLLKGG